MQHIDEHTLTLFVLNVESIRSRHREIEEHLRACYGCRNLATEMKEFYARTEQELAQLEKAGEPPALLPAKREVRLLRRRPGVDVRRYMGPATRIERVRVAVRRHPVVTGATGMAAVACALFFLMLRTSSPGPVHGELSYYRLNKAATSLDLFDGDNRPVWQMPLSTFDSSYGWEASYGHRIAQIADIDADGKKELLTALPLMGRDDLRSMELRLFDDNKNLRWERKFGNDLTYAGRTYPANYTVTSFTAREESSGAARDIFVSATDERSPCAIVRLDKDGNTLGEYWHFGHLGTLHPISLGGERGEEEQQALVLSGINDVNDLTQGEFPAIVVLDPSKITGKAASTTAPGFGVPASAAELYYIRLPFPALKDPGPAGPCVEYMTITQDSLLCFIVRSGRQVQMPHVLFTFDRQFRLREVWLDNDSNSIFREDLISRNLAPDLEKYVKAPMRKGIRYWDGKKWVREVTKVDGQPD